MLSLTKGAAFDPETCMDKVNYFSGGEREALVTVHEQKALQRREILLPISSQDMVTLESEGILSASYVHI